MTQEDLDLMADNEAELGEAIPAFYRAELRRTLPDLPDEGPAQYPRSALPKFLISYGGFLIDGILYRGGHRDGDRFVVDMSDGLPMEDLPQKALEGDVRVTNPVGAAESAVAIHPSDPSRVIAGSNGPGFAQRMHFSSDGGETWQQAAGLPGGGTCCDPSVAWSSDGSKAYAVTLGNIGYAWVYRSADNGETWDDLSGTPARRQLGSPGSDKEYLHIDTSQSSPHRDNLYLTWHDGGVMKFARSTDDGETWTTSVVSSGGGQMGIGSDVTSDRNGAVYYVWPAYNSSNSWLRRSTDGGASFEPALVVASTHASYDFPIPSMDTRNVFVYVSAAADHGTGPFGGSVYAAWTDSTATTTGNPNNNHARIQVAYSRDGGATWQTSTPHETADQMTVDRWHQWLAVGPDGTVHVVFYDTRRDPTRSSVDMFWSYSTDGAATWSAPERLTSEMSPEINDFFEFGDYNGLDVVLDDLIAIFTDNRNEAGGGGDSVDVYAAGRVVGGSGAFFADGFESGDTGVWGNTSG